MSHNTEDVKSHIKLYWAIGGALMVLTIMTVGVSYVTFIHSYVPIAVTVALIIAVTKGSLVASYFMHLVGERKSIMAALGLTAFFFLVLIFLPMLGQSDHTGTPWTLPNANAPAAMDESHDAH